MATTIFIRIVLAFVIVFLSFLGSYIATFALNRLAHIASKSTTKLDDEIILSLKLPVRIFFIIGGIFGANYYLDPDMHIGKFFIIEIYIIIAIIFVAFTLTRIISSSLKWYGRSISQKLKGNDVHDTLFPFVRKIISWVVYLIAVIIVLGRLGIEIGPLLAGLGVAGLAVALALQDTLSNFFAGISILSDKPIKVGEYIRIEGLGTSVDTSLEGFVREVGWRSSRIEAPSGDFIIIPNSKVAQSIILNYSSPIQKKRVVIPIGIDYSSDINKVEKIMIQAVKNVLQKGQFGKQHISKSFNDNKYALILFKGFGGSSLNFLIVYEILDYSKKGLVNSEINNELLLLFRKNNIKIPFPITTVELKK